jgi:hypothetical protein
MLGDNGIFPIGFDVHRPGLADAQVDIERGVVVCTTLADHYVQSMAGLPNIFGPASLHLSDYPVYWDNIRESGFLAEISSVMFASTGTICG